MTISSNFNSENHHALDSTRLLTNPTEPLRIFISQLIIQYLLSSPSFDRAKHFSDQVKSKIDDMFGADVDWESDRPPSLKFVIKKPRTMEMRLEYIDTEDHFKLYDRDQLTQKNSILGTFSPANVTNPSDTTSQDVVNTLKKYVDDQS